MTLELEKPISELNAGEAYLQFMACGGRDNYAYDELFERLEHLLYGNATGYAWKVLGGKSGNGQHKDVVENAVQKSFLKIIRQQCRDKNQRTRKTIAGKWSPAGSATFSSWFNTIVRNEVLSELRMSGLRTNADSFSANGSEDSEDSSVLDEVADEHCEDPVAAAIASEKALKLRRCLDALKDPFRQVLLLLYDEHKTQTEIAEILNANNAAVSRWKKTAHKSIGECVGSS